MTVQETGKIMVKTHKGEVVMDMEETYIEQDSQERSKLQFSMDTFE